MTLMQLAQFAIPQNQRVVVFVDVKHEVEKGQLWKETARQCLRKGDHLRSALNCSRVRSTLGPLGRWSRWRERPWTPICRRLFRVDLFDRDTPYLHPKHLLGFFSNKSFLDIGDRVSPILNLTLARAPAAVI
jgi:hypothetical protein